ncbi:MAG: head GIN domain-containing protein [Bacteroidota bacterium]
MRKLLFLLSFIGLTATVLSSCNIFCEKGNGSPVSVVRDVMEFDEIDIDGQAVVFLEQGSEAKVEVEIDSNLLEFVKTEVSGMKLKIYDDKCLEEVTKYEIHITVPNLSELYVDGSVSIKSESLIKSDNLYIKTKGSGDIHLGVDSEDLETVTKGSGNLKLFGRTSNFEIDLDGAGSIDAYGLLAKTVDANVDGAGTCKINASEKFYGDVGGSGKIYYKGNPKKVKTDVSGSGSIKAK